jgi:hypothetical protein
MKASRINSVLCLAAAAALGAGCSSVNVTEPKRSAIEMLLLSTAADEALQDIDLSSLEGKKVFLEEKYFDSLDKPYVLGLIRDAISSQGGLLMADAEDAEVIVEARAGALSTDSADTLVGIPKMPVPIPLSGTLVIPEAPIYKSNRYDAVAKIALLAYDNNSRAHLFSTGPVVGKSRYHHYRILGYIQWRRTDIPERVSK